MKYAEMISPKSEWIKQEYVTLLSSISYGKNFAIKKKKYVEFVPHYSIDLSYRLGAENGAYFYMRTPPVAWSSGYTKPGVVYNSPGLGASLGANLVLFKRFSVGTEGSYNHFFFQKQTLRSESDEQPNRDLFVQHFKIGWLF